MFAACRFWLLLLIAAFAATAPLAAQDQAAEAAADDEPKLEYREFTDFKGRKAELAVIGFSDRTVQMQRRDGRTLNLSIEKFSEADQTYIRKWAASTAGGPPVLKEYEGHGFDYWAAKFKNPNGEISYGSWEAMTKFGDRGVPILIRMLDSSNEYNRSNAAESLGELRSHAEPAIPKLITMLGEEGYGPRGEAISALANIGEVAVPPLARLLKSDDPRMKSGAVAALKTPTKYDKQIIPVLLPMLGEEDYNLRNAAINSLAHKGESAVPQLLELLEDGDETTRAGAASALKTKTKFDVDQTIPALIKALNQEGYSVRSAAGYSLQNKMPEGAPQIIAALDHDEAEIRRQLVQALAHEEADEATVTALIKMFADPNQQVRDQAAYSVARAGENGFPLVKAALSAKNWQLREGAAQSLAGQSYYGDEENAIKRLGIEADLMKLLQSDEDLAVRTQAAKALGSIESKQGVGLLLGAVDETAPALRKAAVVSINQIQPPAEQLVPVLVELLADKDEEVAENAAETLSEYYEDAAPAVPTLIEIVKNESLGDSDLRDAAASALGNIGDESAVPVLKKYAQDESIYLWSYSMSALGRLAKKSDKAMAALKELEGVENQRVAEEAKERRDYAIDSRRDRYDYRPDKPKGFGKIEKVALALPPPEELQYRGRTLQATINALGDADNENRELASQAVAQFGDAAVKLLIPKLDSIDEAERAQAASALQKLGPKAAPAVPALIKALADEEWRVSSNASYALQAIGPAATPAITAAAKSDDDELRHEAIELLGDEGASDETITLLITFLDKEDDGDYAVGALAECGARAVPALLEEFKSDDEQVRRRVAYALSRMYRGAAGATDALINAVENDTSEEVRASSAEALGHLAQTSSIDVLKKAASGDKSADVRANALGSLSNLYDRELIEQDDMLPLLLVGLQDQDGDVVAQAAQIIRQFEEAAKPAIPFLAATVKDTESDGSWRRQYAIEALGRTKDPSAVAPLMDALKDESEYIRRYAVVALGSIGGPAQKAIPAIKELADDEDEDVRDAVKDALRKIEMPG